MQNWVVSNAGGRAAGFVHAKLLNIFLPTLIKTNNRKVRD